MGKVTMHMVSHDSLYKPCLKSQRKCIQGENYYCSKDSCATGGTVQSSAVQCNAVQCSAALSVSELKQTTDEL